MAAAGLLALVDDIATLLDDVAVYSKVAAKHTAGMLSDDLALNAEQVSGMRARRELPVVWAVAKGSLLNKVILVPVALLVSALLPWLVMPLLMLGGLFLCFEGFEKVAHHWLHSSAEDEARHQETLRQVSDPSVDMAAFERRKIRGAIRTDFILSAEIIVITLGATAGATLPIQALVVALIALAVTVVVYGLVGGIVKFDDAGLALIRGAGKDGWGRLRRRLGQAILFVAPRFMRGLSVVGMIAMFLVGGGILVHGLPFLHHLLEGLIHDSGAVLTTVGPWLFNGLVGLAVGAVVLSAVALFTRVRQALA